MKISKEEGAGLLEPGCGDASARATERTSAQEIQEDHGMGLQKVEISTGSSIRRQVSVPGTSEDMRISPGSKGRKGDDEGYSRAGILFLTEMPSVFLWKRLPNSTDQRNHGKTRLPARYMAGLGMVGRGLGVPPLCARLSEYGSGLPALWI